MITATTATTAKSVNSAISVGLRRATSGRVVAGASLTTTSNRNIRESEAGAAIITTEDIVVIGIIGASTGDISESNVTDADAVGGLPSGAAIEIVLLDVDTVVGDTGHGNVLINNVADL